MNQVNDGAALPGLYPPNAENKARYEAWLKAGGARVGIELLRFYSEHFEILLTPSRHSVELK